jgi:hypothetical protein
MSEIVFKIISSFLYRYSSIIHNSKFPIISKEHIKDNKLISEIVSARISFNSSILYFEIMKNEKSILNSDQQIWSKFCKREQIIINFSEFFKNWISLYLF